MKHNGLDTESALKIRGDILGFPLLYSETVNGGTVRLRHLDLGNTHLQLVEPLTLAHPLRKWLAQHSPGLHHFSLHVEDLGESMKTSPVPTAPHPHHSRLATRSGGRFAGLNYVVFPGNVGGQEALTQLVQTLT